MRPCGLQMDECNVCGITLRLVVGVNNMLLLAWSCSCCEHVCDTPLVLLQCSTCVVMTKANNKMRNNKSETKRLRMFCVKNKSEKEKFPFLVNPMVHHVEGQVVGSNPVPCTGFKLHLHNFQ